VCKLVGGLAGVVMGFFGRIWSLWVGS